jgi:3',5'-cyclic AMP phosphodiesterase CpdA
MEGRKPELILLAGDLATDGRKGELGPLKEIHSNLTCPVHVTPGNHDYEPDQSGKQYDAIFPEQRNYVVEHRGWTILSYDSTENVKWAGVAVQSHTLQWLDETLPRLDRGRPLIVFTHFPVGDGVPLRSTNAEAVLRRFEEHNLRAVFSGHHHGLTQKTHRDISLCTNRCLAFSRGNHDGSKEKGYFIVRATSERVSPAFREFLPA